MSLDFKKILSTGNKMGELSIKAPITPELTFLRAHQCGYVQMPHLEDGQLRGSVWFSGKLTVIWLRVLREQALQLPTVVDFGITKTVMKTEFLAR